MDELWEAFEASEIVSWNLYRGFRSPPSNPSYELMHKRKWHLIIALPVKHAGQCVANYETQAFAADSIEESFRQAIWFANQRKGATA